VHGLGDSFRILVADGPYRHSQPAILGNILQAFGIGFMASRLGFVFLTVANTIFMIRLILHEEAGLLRTQGESIAATSSRSPSLAISPRAHSGERRSSELRDGF